MRTLLRRMLVPPALLSLLLLSACNRNGSQAVVVEGEPESSPIKEVMLKLNDPKGNPSLTKAMVLELKEDPVPWDKLQEQSKEYAQLTATLGKYDPPRGSKESWRKLTSAYAEHADALEMAVLHKDKEAALAAHKEITQLCTACHSEHRVMDRSMGRFSPGKFLAGMLIPKIDTDKDGKLSRGEMVAAVKQFYKDSDKDRKGSLDNKALADGINNHMPMPPRPSGLGAPPGAPGAPPALPPGGPGGAGRPMPPGGGMGGLIGMNVMKRADKNKDGKLTQEELVAAAEALFDEVDKDRTGKLDEEGVGKALDHVMPVPGGAGGPPIPGMGGMPPPRMPPR